MKFEGKDAGDNKLKKQEIAPLKENGAYACPGSRSIKNLGIQISWHCSSTVLKRQGQAGGWNDGQGPFQRY